MNTLRLACLGKSHFIVCEKGTGFFRSLTTALCQRNLGLSSVVMSSAVITTRCFSKKSHASSSHDLEDEHPESKEILRKLRARHHYHGNEKDAKKGHEVFILEPDFKWGRHRFRNVTSEHRLDEACGLVDAIENWIVAGKSVEPVRKLDGKTFFGKGKVEELTEQFQEMRNSASSFDSVFIDVAKLSPRQHKELEDLWEVKVFDRFGVVLQIFKERAKTAEAKIQVELAEIPYIRSRLVHAGGEVNSSYDQQRGGTHAIGGAGETDLEKEKRILFEREQKLKKKLQSIKKHRDHVRHERHKRHVPIIAVVGYTNAGKTTLIKALTGEAKMYPENKLFATLDVTGHPGKLPSGMTVLYLDTVGFVSDLPPELVESFSATLEDIADSDLVVHVRDISHPECDSQLEDVLTILEKQLSLKAPLMENMIEALNKADLCDEEPLHMQYGVQSNNRTQISALNKTGLNKLRGLIEEGIIASTGKEIKRLVIPPDGPQLSWLYHEATVQETSANEEGDIVATVIMDEATRKKYLVKFGKF
ncbi:unnamed protein product [Porites lobata]|uniref:Hflx-type G domain-containing protein n=1 Tax=Porites lobata TaxID=104759 RepID=A0ABN8QTA8_9CNID|nr:unnamed protein product [Porites lobata]